MHNEPNFLVLGLTLQTLKFSNFMPYYLLHLVNVPYSKIECFISLPLSQHINPSFLRL